MSPAVHARGIRQRVEHRADGTLRVRGSTAASAFASMAISVSWASSSVVSVRHTAAFPPVAKAKRSIAHNRTINQ